MNKQMLSKYIIHEKTNFLELFYRFYHGNDINALLVIDDHERLTGIIGNAEMEKCLKDIDRESRRAGEIAKRNFLMAQGERNYNEECFDLFCTNNFSYIPVVKADGTVIDFVKRSDFFQLRMISYAQFGEDIVLQYVLRDVKKIFYIDVGAYDPWLDSVTKWFYDSNKGSGINIEPQNTCYNNLLTDRPRDINIHAACGRANDVLELHTYLGATTAINEYAHKNSVTEVSSMLTLNQICSDHLADNQQIHFLKIDVEGYEKQVLLGTDLKKYRPWIILLESTKPYTNTPVHDDWEHILYENDYIFIKQYSINRFYLAKEQLNLSDSFLEIETIKKRLIVSNVLLNDLLQ